MEEMEETPTVRRDFLSTLRRRFWAVVEVAVAVTIAAALAAQVQTPIYRATATLALMRPGQQRGGVPTPPETPEQADPKLQVRRLTSATVLDRVRTSLELDESVRRLQQKVTANIIEKGQNSNVVAVSVTDADPVQAQRIANEVTDVYVAEAERSGTYATERAIEFVEEQLEAMRSQLAAQETAIEDFKHNNPPEAGQSDAGAGTRLGRFVSIEAEMESIETQMEEAAAQLARTTTQLEDTPEKLETEKKILNPVVAAVRQQIVRLETERAVKLAEYQEESPEIRQLDDQLENLKQMLEGEQDTVVGEIQDELNPVYLELESRHAQLEFELHGLRARKAALEKLKAEHNKDVRTLPGQQTELARLERTRGILESLSNMLQSQYYELQIARAQQPRTAEILQPAWEPRSPAKPNKPMFYAMGLVLGVILGLIFAGLLDQLDDTFADVDELERLLRVPVLGQIPTADEEEPASALLQSVGGPFSDGIHTVHTNLRFLDRSETVQTLCITAADSGAGSTTIASNLAIAIAQSGSEVLLVDANWRSPALHEVLGAGTAAPGLAEVIAGKTTLEEAICPTDIHELRILYAGTPPADPAAALASKRGEETFGQLSQMAEFVIVDTPAAGTVPDAAIAASYAGGTILVTDPLTKRDRAAGALRALARGGAQVIGVVRNRERLRELRRQQYYEIRGGE